MNVMKETLLQEIAALSEKKKAVKNGKWAVRFHIMPPVGWLNDPNGLCFYEGKYNVFFQYSPFDANGGLKLWGRYTSADLVHWNYEGVLLYPDSPYDCHGVYSGCALTDDGKLELFYTGNIKLDGDYDYIHNGREANQIYVSSEDGIHFSEKQCLLKMEDYPADYTCHIRDPKVWKTEDGYRMVLGGRKKGDKGAVLVYRSDDKKNWKFAEEITTDEPFGYMWECPDLFEMNGQTILSASPQGLEREEFRNQNVYQSGYFLMEHVEDTWVPGAFAEWDMGFDFYAPQTFLDDKNRRILIGWAGLPDVDDEYTNPTTELGWQHVLTVPRELFFENGKMYQRPVEEINSLRKQEIPMAIGCETTVHDECFDLEIRNIASASCKITMEDCVFSYECGIVKLEFTGASGSGRTVRKLKTEKLENVRILADSSILEIYLNDGEFVMTTRYYPQGNERTIRYEADCGECSLWELEK